ncbi:MAG TPA: cytochrome P450 [Acidimicrobiales bacterium]|nr:cytochrome P450 [Acidimicrobiales bacterium]
MTTAPTSVFDVIASDRFGPFDWEDPWPTYDRMRSEAPVWMNDLGEWVMTRHADCEAVLRDARFSSNPAHRDPPLVVDDAFPDLAAIDAHVLLFMDPPDHTRLRGLVSKAFTPRTVERLRPRIQELVDGILDRAAERGALDVVADLGYELPVTVICELMGVPLDDRDQFAGWSSDASRLLDGVMTPDELQAGVLASMNFFAYFNELFDERRRDPGDDLISALLAAEEAGDRLSPEELSSIVVLLFIAGHETTMNLIGNGTYALLRHPDQLARWRADPSLDAPAVEELLRFDPPAHITGRTATEDVVVNGHEVRKGTGVVTLVAAANRDPARFSDPSGLDVGRPDNHHLAFSQGMHYCLGAALARLEGQIAIGSLVRRFPDLELVEVPVHRDHFVLRGLRSLRVTTR